jgi:TRAP-type C4-dicarboxylate transport system substrate-binding protein
MLPGIQDGRVDMGLVAPSLFPSQLPLSQIVSIPFLSEDAIGTLKANRELATSNPALANEWAKLGLVPVLFGPAQNAATSFKQPVKDIADLKGKRIRAIGLHADALKAAGALPAAIPTAEVYQAVQTGVLDGFSGSPMGNQVTNQRIQEVAKHFVDLGLGQYTTAVNVVVRKSVWEKMPPEVQQIMIKTAADVVDDFVPTNLAKQDIAACDTVKAAGGTVTRLPNDQIGKWKAQVYDSIVQKYVANAAKGSGLDSAGVTEFVGSYVASLNKFAAQKTNYEDGMSVCGRRP